MFNACCVRWSLLISDAKGKVLIMTGGHNNVEYKKPLAEVIINVRCKGEDINNNRRPQQTLNTSNLWLNLISDCLFRDYAI